MKRISEILASVFIAFFTLLKNLAVDLYHAIYFKALEYDTVLQQTKTPGQRVAIWTGIAVVSFILIIVLLNLLYLFISSIDVIEGVESQL